MCITDCGGTEATLKLCFALIDADADIEVPS
jgi:hypothetical protein